MAETKKGVPPVTPKQKSMDKLTNGARANTGGDHYDRAKGAYSKTPPAPKYDDLGFGD